MSTDDKRTRLALVILMVAAGVVAVTAIIRQDWTLLVWTLIAGGQAAITRSYVGLTSEQAAIIREQGDLLDRVLDEWEPRHD